jgi:Zn-dependent peptidase ImmA (M78 family)
MNKEQILDLALRCTQDDGSVDIVQLASMAGVDVYGNEEPDSFSAEITHIPSENKFEIVVNTTHSLNQQRFSIAHELAHFILHLDKIKQYGSLKKETDSPTYKYSPKIEEEADEFGGELLIPSRLLQEYFPNIFTDPHQQLTFQIIQEIAIRFKTSIFVTADRLKRLSLNVPYISYSYSS